MLTEALVALAGAVVPLVIQHVARTLKKRLPDLLHPEPAPSPAPGPLTLPPLPDGKGSLLLWLADLWERYRRAPESLSPAERSELKVAWHLTPDEEPK
jgi:hypothetical protein